MLIGILVEIKFVQWLYYDYWQLNVEIFLLLFDVGIFLGFCGILDGDYRNDFIRSDEMVDNLDDYYYYNLLNQFLEFWRYIFVC